MLSANSSSLKRAQIKELSSLPLETPGASQLIDLTPERIFNRKINLKSKNLSN